MHLTSLSGLKLLIQNRISLICYENQTLLSFNSLRHCYEFFFVFHCYEIINNWSIAQSDHVETMLHKELSKI